MLLPSLGTSIGSIALPAIAASFAVSIQAVQWAVLGYLLATTTLIVTSGRLGDLLGRRRLLLAGIGIFAGASAGCAVAHDLWLLIAARFAQGIGAAGMMALAVAAVGDLVPKDRTGAAMGVLGAVSAVGTALGPSLGGALIALFGWPSIFAFMGLAAAATFLLVRHLLPADAPPGRRRPALDIAGTLLLAASLAAYALAATVGADTPGPVNLGLAVLAVGGVVAFLAVESRAVAPLVRMDLLRDPSLRTGLFAAAIVAAVMMATLVVGPFYLSGTLELGPAPAGLAMTAGPGVAALAAVPAGRLVDRLGPSFAATSGLATVTVGSLSMLGLPGFFGATGYAGALAIIAAGYALFQAANNTAIMNAASPDRRGVVSALLGLARNLGLITGASAMAATFAFGARGVPQLGMQPGGEAGLQLTFAVAATLSALALAATWRELRRDSAG